MDEKTKTKIKELHEQIDVANTDLSGIWKEDILFTWQWWLGIGFILGFWVLWFRYRKNSSTSRLLYAGFIVIILSSWFDFIGITLGLWYYPVELLPTIPSYVLFDFTLLPILTMILLQYRPEMNTFIKACIFAGVSAFIGEPLFGWLGFYENLHWEYYYSIPILILIYLIAYYLSRRETFEHI